MGKQFPESLKSLQDNNQQLVWKTLIQKQVVINFICRPKHNVGTVFTFNIRLP